MGRRLSVASLSPVSTETGEGLFAEPSGSVPIAAGDDFDPFGEDVTKVRDRADLPLGDIRGAVADIEAWRKAAPTKAKEFKPDEHYAASVKLIQAMHPGHYIKGETLQVIGWGKDARTIKRDVMGLGDVQGWERSTGRGILVQNCAIGQVGAHCRKYVGDDTIGTPKVFVRDHLRAFMECKGLLYVFGWHQPTGKKGSHWKAEITLITTELLTLYASRRRKK